MTPRKDAGREGAAAPTLPDRVPPIGEGLGGLSHASPASAVRFLADGERVWVDGVESRAGFRVGIGDDVVASVTPTEMGTAANVLLFPGVVRRDFVGSRGTCVETLLATPALPLVVGQWRAGVGGGPPSIVVELPGSATAPSTRGRSVVSVGGGRDVVAVGLAPDAASVDVGETDDGTVRIVFEPARSDEIALVVAAGGSEAVGSAFLAAAHASAHAVRAARGPDEGLLLRTGIPEVDDGVRWLRSRLGGMIARHAARAGSESERAPRARGDVLALGLAAIGVGDRHGAARLLTEAGQAHAGPARWGDEGPGVERAILAARFGSVFGDPSHAAAIAKAWSGSPPAEDPLVALAAELMATALDRSERAGVVAELRRLSVRAGSGLLRSKGEASATGERRLPMVAAAPGAADPPEPDRGRWLEGLLAGEPSPPAPGDPRSSVAEARRVCARFRSDPDGAWVSWRERLSRPADATRSPVLWDEPRDERGSLTAELLCGLAYGMLGLDADAPAGRIRVAPRIPSHLTSFVVSGIPVGRCALRMDYERSGGLHRFTLTPEAAPVPPLAVFEPAVRGRLRAVRIDGGEVELDTRAVDGLTIVPCQLPVDGVRIVEIEVGR